MPSLAQIREAFQASVSGALPPDPPMVKEDGQAVSRQAAVALVVREGGSSGSEVLLIRRAFHPKDPWSGHMAFPGGRREASDESLLQTAVRETEEEVGLKLLSDGAPLGVLPPLLAVARERIAELMIAPFVFVLERPVELVSDPAEVDSTHWVDIGELHRGARDVAHDLVVGGRRTRMPAFDVQGRHVWGLTYTMLRRFLEQLTSSVGA